MNEKHIIEINGVKLEVDLSEAKVISNYKIGDRVKVLIKRYSDYNSYAGVLVGFDAFEKLPTLIIAYMESGDVKFLHFNAESKDAEIVLMNPKDMPFEKQRVLDEMDRNISKSERELETLKYKKQFFLSEFGKYFEHLPTGDDSANIHIN